MSLAPHRPALAILAFLLLALVLSACAPAAATPTAVPPTKAAAALPAAPTAAPTVAPTKAAAPAPTPAPTAPAQTAFPLTLTDGAGKSVTIAKAPATIVSLAPNITEILFALGVGDRVVGDTPYCDYPAPAKNVKKVVGMDQRANKEEIARLAPDLVLAGSITNTDDVTALNGLKLTVFTLGVPMSGPKNVDDVLADIETVGKLVGKSDAAKQLTADLKKRVDAVAAKARPAAKPRVFYELDATEPTKPFTPGPGSFIDSLITLAGGANVAADAKMPWAQLSSEEIVKKDPEIIVLGDSKYGVAADQVLKRVGWSSITAVKKNAIYPIDDDLISRAGPRVVDGLEALAKILHPELFK